MQRQSRRRGTPSQTLGAQLEDQEIRNCGARILGDRFSDFLQKIGKLSDFVETIALDNDEVRAGDADELALRFLTMKNWHQSVV